MEQPEPNKQETETSTFNFPLPFEAFVVIIMAVLASYLPFFLLLGVPMDETPPPAPDMTLVRIMLAVGELILLVIPAIYLLRRKLSLPGTLRLNPTPPYILALSVPVGLCLIVLIDEIDRLVRIVLPLPEEIATEIGKTMQIENGLDFVLIMFSAVILASIVEETIFRGFLQQSVEKHIDVTKGVIYSSVVWALVHGSHFMILQIFLFGFFLGWLAWRTNSVLPTMICHGLNNLIAVAYVNYGSGNEPIPYYEWNGHVSPVWLLVALGGLYVGVQKIEAWYRTQIASSASDSDESRHTG